MELAILVGLPGAGKTSFYRERLSPTHDHVSKDLMRHARQRGARQLQEIARALGSGRSVAVDNTNPRREDRAELVAAGRAHGARVVAYYLDTLAKECASRNRAREGPARVPDAAIYIINHRLQPPALDEGFDAVFRVRAEAGTYEVTLVAGSAG